MDIGSVLNEKKDRENYRFLVGNRENRKIEDEYNRAIYFPITNESGQAIADAAKETILKTNGIALETGGHIAPNLIFGIDCSHNIIL